MGLQQGTSPNPAGGERAGQALGGGKRFKERYKGTLEILFNEFYR